MREEGGIQVSGGAPSIPTLRRTAQSPLSRRAGRRPKKALTGLKTGGSLTLNVAFRRSLTWGPPHITVLPNDTGLDQLQYQDVEGHLVLTDEKQLK